MRRSALTLSVSRLIDLTEQRNISLFSSFLSYHKLHYTQYGVVELFWQVGMCQVPLGVERPELAAECIGIFAVTVVMGWALVHVVAVCWGAPQQLAEEVYLIWLGLALIIGVTFVHL